MTTVTWTPDPATPLFEAFESTPGPFSWDITATVEAGQESDGGDSSGDSGSGSDSDSGSGAEPEVTIRRYSGEIKPAQDILSVAGGSDRLAVRAQSLSGLFPIVFIDYLTEKGDLARVDDWDNLPADAPDLVEFRPDSLSEKTFTLTAKVELSNGDTVTAQYNMIILQDWTSGRNRLVAEVNARRRS